MKRYLIVEENDTPLIPPDGSGQALLGGNSCASRLLVTQLKNDANKKTPAAGCRGFKKMVTGDD